MKTSAQEECGVWLDTVQLKGKAKQKRLARPISKLLNPFAGGGGYSLAVALNFTQTKMEMPKTKQSSISAFFPPQGRGLNKKSTSEVTNRHPAQPSPSSTSSTCAAAASTSVTSGTKRRREIDLEEFDLCMSEPGVDHEWKCEDVTEPEAALWWEEQEAEEQFEEVNPPQRKRRLTGVSTLPDDSQPPPQAWSQDPLLTYSQYSDSEDYRAKTCESEPSFLNSLQSEEAFGINVDGRTSTQKFFHSSQTADEKENSVFLPFKSPKKHLTVSHRELLSNHKWKEPKTVLTGKPTPACMLKKADKKEGLESKEQASQLSCRAADEDSLAMLFTQDSEGFRVIAHRGLRAGSPLKDQSNISSGVVRASSYRSVVEDEMLFTQDSQGNIVIKH